MPPPETQRVRYPSDSTEIKYLYMKKYRDKNPWARRYSTTQNNARRKGIEHKMTTADFKELWFRDKAYLMDKPSIDRIDPTKGYIKSNCRYLELSENSRIGNLGRIVSEAKRSKISQTLRSRSKKYCIGKNCLTLTEWSEKTGISRWVINFRVKTCGCTIKQAISPKFKYQKQTSTLLQETLGEGKEINSIFKE